MLDLGNFMGGFTSMGGFGELHDVLLNFEVQFHGIVSRNSKPTWHLRSVSHVRASYALLNVLDTQGL
eukprot:5548129-Amphidinium_carterae.1